MPKSGIAYRTPWKSSCYDFAGEDLAGRYVLNICQDAGPATLGECSVRMPTLELGLASCVAIAGVQCMPSSWDLLL